MALFRLDRKLQLPSIFTQSVDEEAYNDFLKKVSADSAAHFAVCTFPIDCSDPLLYLKSLDPQKEFLFYWEKPHLNKTIAAGGSVKDITAEGPSRFSTVEQNIKEVESKTLHFNSTSYKSAVCFLGGFSFFDQAMPAEWKHFVPASFTLAKRVIVADGDRTSLSVSIPLHPYRSPERIHQQVLNELQAFQPSGETNPKGGSGEVRKISATHYDEWKQAITGAKGAISKDKFDKIVLTRELTVSAPTEFNQISVLNRLRTAYSNCCTYLIRRKESAAFIGSTPERLLSFGGSNYQTEAVAGSMPRGNDKKEDADFERKLYNSYKNKQEHGLVVDHIKNVLKYDVDHVDAHKEPFVKKLTNVQHFCTPVRFKTNASPFKILNKLHPTPALGGYPQRQAVSYLKKHCLINRGWFGSPVGWINSEGEGEFSVAIRSGLLNKNTARLFAGCGIVADSDPQNEWEESDLKLRPMLSALQK